MIGSLRGTVLDLGDGEAVVEVGGVGYRIVASPRTLASLRPGADAFLFTHLHAREDALVLYGFPTREERDTFEVLIKAAGVGPKLALAILSVHDPASLRRAVVEGDADALTLIPGVGKRTAQKLLVELRPRFDLPVGETAPDGSLSARGQVRAALTGLGYQDDEVREVVASLPDEGEVEELLRRALQQLARERVS